jgi:serine/threonine protein kinase
MTIVQEKQPPVAIKQLIEDDEQEFEKERSILEKLGPHNHPHLIKLLSTYRLNNNYHFIFPCAEENLRSFWERRKHPKFDKDTVLWSVKQMYGLASALRLIHTFETTIDLKPPGNFLLGDDDVKLEVVKGEEKYGRHGDIKPENILWFEQPQGIRDTDGMGVLQITDFGLGRFHGRESRSNVDPKTVNATPTYEPPECKLGALVSRAYDLWSMACLYIEFITWLLEGAQKIHDFGDARGEVGEPFLVISGKRRTIVRDSIINDDNFFTIYRDENNVKSAVVREAVVDWVCRLHTHRKCSQAIHDMLDLVMAGLLKPYSYQRINSSELNGKMKEIVKNAASSRDYLLKPIPRAPLPASSSSTVGQRDPTGKRVRFAETWPKSPS